MMNQARAVLAALEEGKVQAIIALYEYGVVEVTQLRTLMKEVLGLKSEDIEYWLDYYGVER